jgi:maleylacetate reductase
MDLFTRSSSDDMDFRFESHTATVLFGKGASASLPKHLEAHARIMVIAGPRYRQLVTQLSEAMGADRIVPFERIVQHVPQELVDEAAGVVRQARPDAILTVGGGSAIGLAKALALGESPELKECYFEDGFTAPEIIAVPTTFSGSEQTDIWGITTAEGKETGRSRHVLPRLVVYDPVVLTTLPAQYAAASAMNAMAHLVEAAYAPDGNPVTRFQALQGIEAMADGLRRLGTLASKGDSGGIHGHSGGGGSDTISSSVRNRSDDGSTAGCPVEIVEKLLFGAFLGGKCLREVSMALQHKAAHVLGGMFGCDHAETHAVLLPHVLQYQWPHLGRDIRADLEQVLGPHPPKTLQELAALAGLPTDLQALGVKKSDLTIAADRILAKPYPNPAPLDRVLLLAMLENAWIGIMQPEQQLQ